MRTEGSAWLYAGLSPYCYCDEEEEQEEEQDEDKMVLSEPRQEQSGGNQRPNLGRLDAQLGRIVGYQTALPGHRKSKNIVQLNGEMLLQHRHSPRKLLGWLVGHLPTAAPTFIQYVPQIWCLHNYTCTCSLLSPCVCGLHRAPGFLPQSK